MKYCQKIHEATDKLEKACSELEKLCQCISESRPDDNPQVYKTVEAFENAWNKHYSHIDQHQHKANEFDKALMEVQDALSQVSMPMFELH